MIAKEWLKAAEDDLILIQEIMHNPAITNLAAFHAQQAIEKSLKAYLEHKKIPFRKTHKLQTLLDQCEIILGQSDDELIQLLDELYIESRYPGEFGLLPTGKPSLEEIEAFYAFAKKFHDYIKEQIDEK